MQGSLVGRRLPVAVALVVGVMHFVLTTIALRALLAGQGGTQGPSAAVAVAVAVLGFPLFYTPFRPTLGGLVPAGWLVAALNALLWAAIAFVIVGLRRRRT
jgi:hypothetical protein